MAWADRRAHRARTGRYAALLCLLTWGAPAHADALFSAEELRDACTRPVEAWVSFCTGYAQAAVDFAVLADLACVPDGTARSDIVTEIDRLAFGRIASGEIPGDMPALTVAVSVLQTLYPCDPDGEASE